MFESLNIAHQTEFIIPISFITLLVVGDQIVFIHLHQLMICIGLNPFPKYLAENTNPGTLMVRLLLFFKTHIRQKSEVEQY